MRKRLILTAAAMIFSYIAVSAATAVTDLRIQHSTEPNTITDRHPLISWRMESDERGMAQQAYRLRVFRESDGSCMWDSGRVESSVSVNIPYQGVALQPERGYSVRLSVWDIAGEEHRLGSRFETGLRSTRISAWDGAQWIGSQAKKLNAGSLCLFEINSQVKVQKGGRAEFILGAGDRRYSNAFLNGYGMNESENYVKVSIDFAGRSIDIFSVGHFPCYGADRSAIRIDRTAYPNSNLDEVFSARNPEDWHDVRIIAEASNLSFVIDGKDVIGTPRTERRGAGPGLEFSVGNMAGSGIKAEKFCFNEFGRGGDFPSLPNLCSVGFAAAPGSEVLYRDYRILQGGRSTDSTVFSSSDGRGYTMFKGLEGLSIEGSTIRVSNPGKKEIRSYADPSFGAEAMLRTEFTASRTVKSAKLYASAMGIYDIYLNGEKVGKDFFAPGDSQYRETICYTAYDVTPMLRCGANAIGAELAGGWFTGYMTFTPANYNFFGDHEALLCRLVITYEDGGREVIVSGPDSWKCFNDGPVRYGSFFMGEVYDAGKVLDGWSLPGFDDSGWKPAETISKREWIDFEIVPRYDEPVREREVLSAQRVTPVHSADGHTYIYDMGVNMVGVPSIDIPEGWLKEGDEVLVTYAEQLYPGVRGDSREYIQRFGKKGRNVAGHLLLETNRAAMNLDIYTAAGSGAVTISPSKSYRGYQYIQITLPSHQGPLPLQNVRGRVLSSCETPTGSYRAVTADGTTGELAGRLFRNIQRSQLGNFFTIPTDCPQRNERMGWTGDAQAYTRTGIYNADIQNFYRQWMVALRADQGIGDDTNVPGGIGSTVPTYNTADDTNFASGTTWAAAVCMVPWQMYIQYGDTQIIEENIETMVDWLNGMAYYRMSEEYPHLSSKTSGLADWLALDPRTTSDIVNNAIYLYMMEVTAIMADAIGRGDYAATLRERHRLAKQEWNRAYVDPESGRTRSLKGDIIHSQASYATPLNFNAFDEKNKPLAEKWLAQTVEHPEALPDGTHPKPYTITTGFSGTPNILPALSRSGRKDLAYKMFSCKDYASWLYPVTKGATSVWERWNSYDTAFAEHPSNNMNSFNHFALGAVGQWMYEFQLGITTEHSEGEAGYRHFVLQPSAGEGFTSLEGSYDSNYGRIRSAWTADGKGNMLGYEATVPANTSATLYLPVDGPVTPDSLLPSDGSVRFTGFTTRNGIRCARYELRSGRYVFTINEDSVAVR